MEDSMINMPDLVFDEKIGSKRVRDGEDQEIHKGRLEKRPSGIFGVNGDDTGDGGHEGGGSGGIYGGSGGIIDTFISNVFQKNSSGDEDEVKTGVFNAVEDEDKRDDHLGVDGSGGHGGDADGGGGGGSVIGTFFSNIFLHNGSAGEEGGQAKSDESLHEVAEKTECLGGAPGSGEDGGGEPEEITAGKSEEKKDEVVDLAGKDPTGHTLNLKPDEYSERVFFLNNN